MACVWVLLASRTTDERLCGKPGDPQCLEHQRELDAMKQADKNCENTCTVCDSYILRIAVAFSFGMSHKASCSLFLLGLIQGVKRPLAWVWY
jgi:hypothetical protein